MLHGLGPNPNTNQPPPRILNPTKTLVLISLVRAVRGNSKSRETSSIWLGTTKKKKKKTIIAGLMLHVDLKPLGNESMSFSTYIVFT